MKQPNLYYLAFLDWINKVITSGVDKSVVAPYGLQSPLVVNDYLAHVFGAKPLRNDAYELEPYESEIGEHWVWLRWDDLKIGDIAVIDRNAHQPYGDCVVITAIKHDNKVLTGIGVINGKIAQYRIVAPVKYGLRYIV